MRSSSLLHIGTALMAGIGITDAAYTIQDTFDNSNFFSEFTFFADADPTAGFVKYATASAANLSSLAGYTGSAVYLGVDHTTVNPPGGRHSVRVTSNKSYTRGLFIADIAHMPDSTCGVWPAFWTFGPNWPSSGEIDIIEGVNAQTTNTMTLHTSAGCTITGTGAQSSSTLSNTNCNAGNGNDGCGFSSADTRSYGSGFNALGGGIYAMDWTSSAINVYFFPRTSITPDITSGTPAPETWGTPVASFSGSGDGCDIDTHFANHNIVFNTDFCGGWAGSVWSSGSCASLASTCDAYVAANPTAFVNAYWEINSVKVYQDGGNSTSTATTTTRRARRARRVNRMFQSTVEGI
ncbi:concanavalin A-like lectin/glucanase domain-containing protein [Xylogone sp. PMI_703]|nr:concanavalin A-like lectin/glucanase domain-containing protein [Xylogone sp. PMI_703]